MTRMQQDAKLPPPRLRYPITEVAQLLGLDRGTVYRRINAGQLSIVRDGGRVYVLRTELERYSGQSIADLAG